MKTRQAIPLVMVACVLLVALPPASIAQERDDSQYLVELKSREFIPSPGIEPSAVEELAAAPSGRRHMLLQLHDVPDDAQRAALEAAEVRLLAYVPSYAWFASLPADIDLQDPGLGSIRWIGAIRPEDRVAPILREPGVQQGLVDEQGQIGLDLRFFADVGAQGVLDVLRGHGAVVEEDLSDFHRYVVRVAPAALGALAAEDGVQWIEPAAPLKTVENDGTRARTHVNAVQAAPYNLNGSNVDLGIWDGGKVATHVDFAGRLTVVDWLAFVADHATHVAGTMAGDGGASGSQGGTANQWRGMAPGADIFSYYWDNNLTDHNGAINTYGIELSQNSWGYTIDQNNCSLYGDYTYDAPDYDDIVTGRYGNKHIVVVFAAGNERNDCDCGMSCAAPYVNYANVGPPGTAKNILTVGATNSQNDTMTEFSSFGPVDDGRLKPEIVAPGCEEPRDDYNPNSTIWSTLPGNVYGGMCGTSMAAPVVSGISALIIQQYRAASGGDPWPSTVKALLVHTAVDLNDGTSYFNPGPDYASGYGRVDVQAAVDAILAGRVREDQVSNGQTDTFYVDVPPGTPSLKVTLAWDDEPGTVNANPALVNNLDLVLAAPGGGTLYRPWILNPAQPSSNATTGIDNRNNLEQVVVNSPVAGTWEVRVVGSSVPVGPQSYSLAGQAFSTSSPTRWVYLPLVMRND